MTFTEEEQAELIFMFNEEFSDDLREFLETTLFVLDADVLERTHRKPGKVEDNLQQLADRLAGLHWQVKSHLGDALDQFIDSVNKPYEPASPKYRRDTLKVFIRTAARDHVPYSHGDFVALVDMIMRKAGMDAGSTSAAYLIRETLKGQKPDYQADDDRKYLQEHW